MKFLVALVALVAVASAASLKAKVTKLGAFEYDTCPGTSDTDIVITQFDIQPDPIVVPGDVTYSISLTGDKDITSPTEGDIVISYRADASAEWESVDCSIVNMTSCHINDVCQWLDEAFKNGCPEDFTRNNVPCKCPITAGDYSIPDGAITIATPLETLQAGDYKLQIALTQAGVELQCYYFQVTLVAAA